MQIRRTPLALLFSPAVFLVALACIQSATVGLSAVSLVSQSNLDSVARQGFSTWLRITHYA